jgi:flagellar assembly protein FliH
MQDMSPEAIDHEAIMRMIREGAAFRPASPVERVAPEALAPGFRAVPPDEVARLPAEPKQTAGQTARQTAAPSAPDAGDDGFRPAPEPMTVDLDAIRAEARAAGRAEAVTRGGEEAAPRLFAALEAAILRLASDRAGMAIDANPDHFRHRIAALVARVEAAGAATEIHLNPADLAALGEAALPPGLRADATLARGDAVVRVGDVRLDDILTGDRPQGGAR